ncbi:MAG TPA: GNAT family N-acetyltransferase [Acidimicrobiales bacterium]|nr:GNAT family N-acetyltransferase [Acidimicrobiales bacterium]
MEAARPAQTGDLSACARLLEQARHDVLALRGGPELLAACTCPPPGALDGRWLRDHWMGPDRALLVGTLSDVVVGLGAGHLTSRGTEQVGSLDCCYVESGARGVGVGTAILDALVQWFTAGGCVALDAPALPGDRATKQLFESQGLSARLLVLHRRLPRHPGRH